MVSEGYYVNPYGVYNNWYGEQTPVLGRLADFEHPSPDVKTPAQQLEELRSLAREDDATE
jgi:hypothetical protein